MDPNILAQEFLGQLPLPERAEGSPVKLLAYAIRHALRNGERLVVVSSICPSYSTNVDEVPDYQDLETGISPNIQKHFTYLVPAISNLEQKGVDTVHFFLMADTEVDLLPFLKQLKIEPNEFTRRCQLSVEEVGRQAISAYGNEVYKQTRQPPAARFLDFFGEEEWFGRYEYLKDRLIGEYEANPFSRIGRGLSRDYDERKVLIGKLLGRVSREDGIAHIARQKAQYMTFASLMRDRFGERLVVVNHRTPNFAWMNDRIAREPMDEDQKRKGNYQHKLPLIELDISTMPKK